MGQSKGSVRGNSYKVFVKDHLCYTPLLPHSCRGRMCPCGICHDQHQYRGWGSTNAK